MKFPSFRAARFLMAAALLITFVPAEGATVKRLELTEVRDGASSIYWGQVVDRSTRIGPNGKMVWTDYEVSVSEHLRGDDPGIRTTVSFAGGTAGGLSIGIPGMPRLEVGGTYVFFLNKKGPEGRPYINATIGWAQGLYRIERVNVGGTIRDILVSYDGQPLEKSADGRIARGARIAVASGSFYEPTLRRDASTRRMPDPTFTSADGTRVPQRVKAPDVMHRRQRNFATLDDLRSFVDGRIGSVPSEEWSR